MPFGTTEHSPSTPGQPPKAAGRMPQYIQVRFNGVDLGGPDATVLDFVGAGVTLTRGTGADADKITITIA